MKAGALTLLLYLLSCSAKTNAMIEVHSPNQDVLYCELAQSPQELQQGLMFRTQLARNHGMLFVFPHPSPWSFWMKNTLIPLDIIWLDEQKKVIHLIENALPCRQKKCPEYQPRQNQAARYVLELPAHTAKTHAIQIGQHLKF